MCVEPSALALRSRLIMMRTGFNTTRRGFSLIELVIVVVIIAVIGAIAATRYTRGATASNQAAMQTNWNELQKAVDRFTAEHGVVPSLARISAQLTQYTDEFGGGATTTPDSTHSFGPYLRNIPAVTAGPRAGQNGISNTDGPTIGWIYAQNQGLIRPNVPTVPVITGESDPVTDLSADLGP